MLSDAEQRRDEAGRFSSGGGGRRAGPMEAARTRSVMQQGFAKRSPQRRELPRAQVIKEALAGKRGFQSPWAREELQRELAALTSKDAAAHTIEGHTGPLNRANPGARDAPPDAIATDPPVSEAQRRAMHAAASGKSNIGIPQHVGKEFAEADPGGSLPKRKSSDHAPQIRSAAAGSAPGMTSASRDAPNRIQRAPNGLQAISRPARADTGRAIGTRDQGTSAGAKKGWETRQRGGGTEPGAPQGSAAVQPGPQHQTPRPSAGGAPATAPAHVPPPPEPDNVAQRQIAQLAGGPEPAAIKAQRIFHAMHDPELLARDPDLPKFASRYLRSLGAFGQRVSLPGMRPHPWPEHPPRHADAGFQITDWSDQGTSAGARKGWESRGRGSSAAMSQPAASSPPNGPQTVPHLDKTQAGRAARYLDNLAKEPGLPPNEQQALAAAANAHRRASQTGAEQDAAAATQALKQAIEMISTRQMGGTRKMGPYPARMPMAERSRRYRAYKAQKRAQQPQDHGTGSWDAPDWG